MIVEGTFSLDIAHTKPYRSVRASVVSTLDDCQKMSRRRYGATATSSRAALARGATYYPYQLSINEVIASDNVDMDDVKKKAFFQLDPERVFHLHRKQRSTSIHGSSRSQNGETGMSQNLLAAALTGFSIEVESHAADSFRDLSHRLPEGTDVFLNLIPKDSLERQIDSCRQIRNLGFTPIPHLVARRVRSIDDVSRVLGKFTEDAGVRDFLIIAGDLDQPADDIRDSLDFIREIRSNDFGIRRIGISGYPEGHPLISDEDLRESQQEKIRLLKDFGIEPIVVTQFSFEPDAIIRYCKEIHSQDPDIKIKNGLPGPAKLMTLMRFAQRCGVAASIKKLKALPVTTSLRLLQRVPPSRQAEALGKYRLERNDNVTVHLFTFGGVEASLDWIEEASG